METPGMIRTDSRNSSRIPEDKPHIQEDREVIPVKELRILEEGEVPDIHSHHSMDSIRSHSQEAIHPSSNKEGILNNHLSKDIHHSRDTHNNITHNRDLR